MRSNSFPPALSGDRAIVAVQNPVELNDYSEPQPDIALLEPRPDFYASGYPKPADIFLIFEVADSTIKGDRASAPLREREIKISLYAEDNIREVWLIDINQQCLEVDREPPPNGYKDLLKYNRENLEVQIKFASAIDLHKWLVAHIKPMFPWYYEVSKCSP